MISIKQQRELFGEKMKKSKKFLIIGIIIILISGGLFFSPGRGLFLSQGRGENNELFLLIRVYQIIKEHYIEKVDSSKLIEAGIKGMIESLEDPHSRWINSKSYKEMEIRQKGELGGLGITITIKDNFPTVVSLVEDTPASKAGIEPGDKIITINGEPTKGINLEEAAGKLRGKAGTSVQITIRREGKEEPLKFTIIRAIYKIPNIKWRLINKDTGYLQIISFMDENTDKDIKKALKELKDKKISFLILDLRNNPGGALEQAIEVANEFLRSGIIVSTKGREPSEDKTHYAYDQGEAQDIPLIVLVNEGSASASEIVAGAIKDNQRGVLVGTKTFGKGTVQWVFPVQGEGALSLTTAKYYTPSGKCIDGIGIESNINVEAFKATKEENEIIEKLKKSPLIKEFLNQYPYWEKENLSSLIENLKEEDINIETDRERALLERVLREKDGNKENDIFNDLQLIQAIKILKSWQIFEKSRLK